MKSKCTAYCVLLTWALRGLADSPGGGLHEFSDLLARYGKIHTIAGRAQLDSDGGNDWRESYEGGPALDAELSEAHNAQADARGNVYIVDKDAHAVRKVTRDGTIHRVAGTNLPGDGTDEPQEGSECALNIPNGLHVHPDGTCFIFDTGNRKIRRLDRDGRISTVFRDAGLALVGRGLWVNLQGTLIYYANGADVRKWTPADGIRVLATGFSGGLGNLTVDPQGRLVVTDRSAHSVYRIQSDGTTTRIAGNGTTAGGGHGQAATATGLEEVRGVAFVPTGGFFVGTHRGSDVWFIDNEGVIHLFIGGVRNSNPFAGEGTLASGGGNKLSEIRAINITPGGDLIITQSDESNVRIVENVCPPAIGAVQIAREDGGFIARWNSSWDGWLLEKTTSLTEAAWTVLSEAGAVAEDGEWREDAGQPGSRAFLRVRPALRWPAP